MLNSETGTSWLLWEVEAKQKGTRCLWRRYKSCRNNSQLHFSQGINADSKSLPWLPWNEEPGPVSPHVSCVPECCFSAPAEVPYRTAELPPQLTDTACGKDPPLQLCSLAPDVKQYFGKDALQHLIGCLDCDLGLTVVKTEAACTCFCLSQGHLKPDLVNLQTTVVLATHCALCKGERWPTIAGAWWSQRGREWGQRRERFNN